MEKRDRKIGFIGIGVLGKGLALAMTSRGYHIAAAYSRSRASAQWLANRVEHCRVLDTPQEVADLCDLVFITTPDSAIREVAESVSWRASQGVVHCSGAACPEILKGASDQNAVAGAFHPFQTFAGLDAPQEAATRLSGVTFAISGQGWLPVFLQELARNLEGYPVSIADTDRPLYHASAVLGCGYLAALLQAAVEPWREMGFTDEQAVNALYPLARVTLENISKHGIAASVTGPVARGDAGTVESHLVALSARLPALVPLYGELAAASLPLVAGLGLEEGRLEDLRRVIDQYSGRCLPCPE